MRTEWVLAWRGIFWRDFPLIEKLRGGSQKVTLINVKSHTGCFLNKMAEESAENCLLSEAQWLFQYAQSRTSMAHYNCALKPHSVLTNHKCNKNFGRSDPNYKFSVLTCSTALCTIIPVHISIMIIFRPWSIATEQDTCNFKTEQDTCSVTRERGNALHSGNTQPHWSFHFYLFFSNHTGLCQIILQLKPAVVYKSLLGNLGIFQNGCIKLLCTGIDRWIPSAHISICAQSRNNLLCCPTVSSVLLTSGSESTSDS